MRFISIRCSGETLSEVTLLPREPHPKVSEGEAAVERPSAPWVVKVLTTTRETGIFSPKATAARLERVWGILR